MKRRKRVVLWSAGVAAAMLLVFAIAYTQPSGEFAKKCNYTCEPNILCSYIIDPDCCKTWYPTCSGKMWKCEGNYMYRCVYEEDAECWYNLNDQEECGVKYWTECYIEPPDGCGCAAGWHRTSTTCWGMWCIYP